MKKLKIILAFVMSILFSACEQVHVKPPLTIGMRESYVHGYVLQITNRSSEHLECRLYASDNKTCSKTIRFVLKSGETQEIGHIELDGWFLEAGEYVIISVVDYLLDIKVQFYNSGQATVKNILLKE